METSEDSVEHELCSLYSVCLEQKRWLYSLSDFSCYSRRKNYIKDKADLFAKSVKVIQDWIHPKVLQYWATNICNII